jgi:hypothetical protein
MFQLEFTCSSPINFYSVDVTLDGYVCWWNPREALHWVTELSRIYWCACDTWRSISQGKCFLGCARACRATNLLEKPTVVENATHMGKRDPWSITNVKSENVWRAYIFKLYAFIFCINDLYIILGVTEASSSWIWRRFVNIFGIKWINEVLLTY